MIKNDENKQENELISSIYKKRLIRTKPAYFKFINKNAMFVW